MILSDAERDFLHSIVIERIQQHYEKNRSLHQVTRTRIQELGLRFSQILEKMDAQDAEVIRDYQELCSHLAADAEIEYYQSGILDGIRLVRMVYSL